MNNKIKVGYLISYDYQYLEISLPTIYKNADYIALAIDKDRKTWSGTSFNIPDSFFNWIKEIDIDKKIHIYEDSFYDPTLSTIECDTRERNMLARFMGDDGWHIQIDTDEYFLDFSKFIQYIKSLDINISTIVYAEWITMFKQSGNDTLLIDSCEIFPLATNRPVYKKARFTDKLKKNIYTKFKVIHQSWARSEDELAFKLKNWSHAQDFNVDAYFNLWKVLDRYTYKYLANFHPMNPPLWKSLECVEADNITILIEKVKEIEAIKIKNNRLFNRFKSTFSKKKKKR
ncbi:hypothetical protein [Dysgonomonas sp. ZJ279]|uniref:hypothetical protein n=1 Tax=Dysgonomonas sp. ZJ279 TaxID=2709796 RepID=UPI0013EB7483|nr:hypothetical protein [Dysgonomonas sp. ZJ279]